MTNEEMINDIRPYDSAWGMYCDEFDNAKPDEIKTWVRNHKERVKLDDVLKAEFFGR